MDVHVHRSSLGKHLSVNFFFKTYWWVLGNLYKADVSNQDPWRTERNGQRVHTDAHGHRRMRLTGVVYCDVMTASRPDGS